MPLQLELESGKAIVINTPERGLVMFRRENLNRSLVFTYAKLLKTHQQLPSLEAALVFLDTQDITKTFGGSFTAILDLHDISGKTLLDARNSFAQLNVGDDRSAKIQYFVILPKNADQMMQVFIRELITKGAEHRIQVTFVNDITEIGEIKFEEQKISFEKEIQDITARL